MMLYKAHDIAIYLLCTLICKSFCFRESIIYYFKLSFCIVSEYNRFTYANYKVYVSHPHLFLLSSVGDVEFATSRWLLKSSYDPYLILNRLKMDKSVVVIGENFEEVAAICMVG